MLLLFLPLVLVVVEGAPALDHPLLDAAVDDDVDTVASLLQNGASDLDSQNEKGESALIVAAKSGNNEILSLLLQQSADVNIQDVRGDTALMKAAAEGYNEVVASLLAKKRLMFIFKIRERKQH